MSRRGVIVLATAGVLIGVALWSSTRPASLDRRAGVVAKVISGDTIEFAADGGATTTVRLLGIDAPDAGEHAEKSKAYLEARTTNGRVTLRLDELTRPGEAYVYLADNELLNEAIVRDGWAFADRQRPCDFSGLLEQQENAARSAKRGMWRTVTLEQMPAWRQAWMRERGLK